LKGIFDYLPVGLNFGTPGKSGRRELCKRIPVETASPFSEVLNQRLAWNRIDIDKDEALPGIQRDWGDGESGPVQVKKARLVRYMTQRSIQAVRPTMEFAGKQTLAGSRRIRDELVTAV